MNFKRIGTAVVALALLSSNSFAQSAADGMNTGGHAVAGWLHNGGIWFFAIALMFAALMSVYDHHNVKYIVYIVIGAVVFYGAVPFVGMIQSAVPSGL